RRDLESVDAGQVSAQRHHLRRRRPRYPVAALHSRVGPGQMTIHPDEFDPQRYARGSRHRLFAAFGDSLGFPLLLARGSRPGPTWVATANVHGDEYEGVRAILDTFESLDAGEMSGDLIAVPVVNGPAFWSGTRTSPLDGANLARVFPGDASGTPSQ